MRVGRRWAIGLATTAVAATTALAASPATSRPTTQPAPVELTPATPPSPRRGRREPVLPPPLPTQTATTATAPSTPRPATAPTTAPATQPVTVTPAVPIPDPVAYWAGLVAGHRIRERLAEDGRGFDDLVVLKGFIDGLSDHDPAFARADVQAAADQVQANVLQRRAEKRCADDPAFRRLADDNQQRSRDLLAENAKLAGVRALPDGVQVRVLHDGTGRPVAAAKAVTARLSVSLADGTLVAAADPNRPVRLVLSELLPAVVDATRDMRVGDRWQVMLPPDKAYGLAGNPPMIAPNQALAYDIELLDAQ